MTSRQSAEKCAKGVRKKTTHKLRGWMFEKHRHKCDFPNCNRWTEPTYLLDRSYCKKHEKIMDFFHRVIDIRIEKFLSGETFRIDKVDE